MSEWKEYKLGEIAEVVPGYAFKGKDFGFNGVPIIKIGDINPPMVEISNCLRILESKLTGLEKFQLKQGDFVLAMTGATLGKVGRYLANEIGYLNQRVAKFNSKRNLSDKRFLYYLITSENVSNEIINRGLGSAQPNVSGKDIESIIVSIPDLSTQTAIAEILSSLDDKIELNNQINHELEALAQAIFKQWFIDFEFPNEKGKPYKSSGGKMVESELGEIPKGWRISIFNEHLESCRGLSYKGSGLADSSSGVPMVNLNSVYEGGGYKYEGIKYYSGDYKERHVIKPWDLAVTNTEQGHKYLLIGYPAVIPKQIGELGIFSHHIYRVRTIAGSPLTNQFFYYLMLQPPIREQIIGACNGTTVNMLKIDGLERPKFIQPSTQLVANFSSMISSIWEHKENTYHETHELRTLRDTLLPKLISGELDVSTVLKKKAK